MDRLLMILIPLVILLASCERDRESQETDSAGVPDTATTVAPTSAPEEMAPGAEPPAERPERTEAPDDTATGTETILDGTVEATGPPSPPGGYAVESRPAENGRLARIEYLSPRTVDEVDRFYSSRLVSARRVEIEAPGDDLIAYGLSSQTTLAATSTATDVHLLLERRSEPVVVIAPHRVRRDDRLVRDLRELGQPAQAESLLATRSKVTVVYAVP